MGGANESTKKYIKLMDKKINKGIEKLPND